MQLTKEQIENLYAFTKKHGVKYYDLQTELVDHIANDIEDIWQQNPKLTFEQARYKATIKFGIYGFSSFIKERDKALNKKYWRLFRQFFTEFFTVPKIVLTLFLIALTYLLFEISPKKNTLLFGSLFVISALFILYAIFLSINRRIVFGRTGKKWMYEEIITGISSIPFIFIVILPPWNFYNLLKEENMIINWSFYNQFLFATLLVALTITFYISLIVIPSKIKETVIEESGKHRISK